MYDDFGLELGTDTVNSPLRDIFTQPLYYGTASIDAAPEPSTDWSSSGDTEGAFWVDEDPLILPKEGDYTFKADGGDDWLVPLSNGDVTDLGEIVVTGRRYTPTTPGSYYNPYDYGGWDGHDTSVTVPSYVPEELPDCVSASPAGIDEDALIRVLQYLTDEFKGVYNDIPGNTDINSARYEYGVFIYEIDGQIGYGNIQTSNSADYVDISTGGIPDGARIIAWMHNHPNQSGIDDRIPSSGHNEDWDQHSRLINANLGRGITVDPNLLLALFSNQDGKTRIYDNNDRNTNTASCPISGS